MKSHATQPSTLALAAAIVCLVAATAGEARADEAARGRAAIARFGCVRCHEVPGFVADVRTGCTACHQDLVSRTEATLARRRSVTHFVEVPSLASAALRLRSEWMIDYLVDPHDVRPHLEESMPRLPVSRAEARAIVAYLGRAVPRPTPARRTPTTAPAPDPAHVARGRRVFAENGCTTCHTFGNVDFGTGATEELYRLMRPQALLAPNLRLAKERLDPATMLAWITDPTSVDPTARMPRPSLSAEDAVAVRDFLIFGEAGAPVAAPRAPTAPDLSPLGRPVRFAEVRRVFARSCVHCHAKTSSGAAAGLGFSASALDLSTWQGVRAGTQLPGGTRRSVLDAPRAGTPLLVARLLRRHEEAARDVAGPYRDTMTSGVAPAARADVAVGMPLGLPPVSAEDVRLVATWIAQGAPR
jgi:cytochrome c2